MGGQGGHQVGLGDQVVVDEDAGEVLPPLSPHGQGLLQRFLGDETAFEEQRTQSFVIGLARRPNGRPGLRRGEQRFGDAAGPAAAAAGWSLAAVAFGRSLGLGRRGRGRGRPTDPGIRDRTVDPVRVTWASG